MYYVVTAVSAAGGEKSFVCLAFLIDGQMDIILTVLTVMHTVSSRG